MNEKDRQIEDARHLVRLEEKLSIVRDYTTAVANSYQHGFYLYGDGGCGKSYTVIQQLRSLEVSYQLFNSGATAKGVFCVLRQYPDEVCLEITDYLVHECRSAGCRADLRMQEKAYRFYLQFEAGATNVHWRDIVSSSIREAAVHFRHESNDLPMEEQRKHRRNAIRQIVAEAPEADTETKVSMYKEKTGGSRSDFFRKKREVESGEFDEFDLT